MSDSEGLAMQLLDLISLQPSCDELFERVTWLAPAERRAVIAKMRDDRTSWGSILDEVIE